MVYYYDIENNDWMLGNKVSFSDGTVISKDNKIEHEGWFWSDEPPTEYNKWLEQQQNI
jgi:hypothetical protein